MVFVILAPFNKRFTFEPKAIKYFRTMDLKYFKLLVLFVFIGTVSANAFDKEKYTKAKGKLI